MIHDLPPIVINGLFTLGAAGVTGLLSWFGGDKSGKNKVRADFISEIERASTVVLTRVERQLEKAEAREAACVAQHQECIGALDLMKRQIEDLMASTVVPPYREPEISR